MDRRELTYCLLMWDTKTGETSAMNYAGYQDALGAMKTEAGLRWKRGEHSEISDERGEACVNGRYWKILRLNEASARIAASGIPCYGSKITMYIPQRSKLTGRLMFHCLSEYAGGGICYVPECAFTYALYCKSDPMTRGEYAVIDEGLALRMGYDRNLIQSVCEFAIGMYYPELSKRGVRAEAGLDVFLRLNGETVDDFIRDAPADFIETLVKPAQNSDNIHN